MKKNSEDTYFLDRDLAYLTALAHNIVKLEDGQLKHQLCYYDGEPFQHAPDNLVNVPADLFTEFFSKHPNRVPKCIDTTSQQASLVNESLLERFQGILSLAKKSHRDNQ